MTIFSNLEENLNDHNWFFERAILFPPKNDVAITKNDCNVVFI